MPSRTAIYTRVSTFEQTVEPQLLELRTYAKQKGLVITHELSDVISGAKDSRDGLNELLRLVRAREIDALMVVKIDRLARSLSNFARICDELKTHRVALIIPGQGIDTSNANPCGEMQLGVLAVIAQFERSLISERTKAGLAVARANGKILGKPSEKLPPEIDRKRIVREWVEAGAPGYDDLAKRLGGVSRSTAWRIAEKLVIVTPPPEIEEVEV